MDYLIIKWVHIVSSTLLFGTGLGSAFYKYFADRSGNIPHIAHTNRIVVLADWLFTTPTVLIQPMSGLYLALKAGYSLTEPWLIISIMLYLIAGLCWLPVVVLQIRMRDLALESLDKDEILDHRYHRAATIWFWLGVPAFTAIMVVFFLLSV